MLTADLVHVRRRGKALKVVALDEKQRARAVELATLYLTLARDHVGRSRAELEEAWAAVDVAPRERRLADGICKLVEDRCQLDPDATLDPEELRRDVFARAAHARRDGSFDRAALLDGIARERGLDSAAVERALYNDLRAAHILHAVESISPARLVEEYDLAQAQAVLLRAVRVVVDVECRTPGAYRALFHKLKFLRLLHTIAPHGAGYRIEIDGPFSLFESVTKYGLQLALALPAIRACDAFHLTAEVRWGKERAPLTFELGGKSSGAAVDEPPRLADEVARLLDDLRAVADQGDTPWRAAPSTEILTLPGVGLCIPDLAFEHTRSGEIVYLEVLGFWSRDAVWRRVELVERGLPARILFAVSKHLRVSEAVLDDDAAGALYVYKRVMSARAILERIDALSARATRGRPS
jgi:hypothetical protein